MTDSHGQEIDDAIGDILLDTLDDRPLAKPLTLPAPVPMKTPAPDPLLTPPPTSSKTPGPLMMKPSAPLSLGTPEPLTLKTPAPVDAKPIDAKPVDPKTPAPLSTRDPSSGLPSIPAAKKEPSGAFPLPGMAGAGGTKRSDEDVTLIARLSVLDDLVEESTKVEPIDAVLRAATKNDEPIALADQALAERDKALGISPLERMSAAEFEDPGDDDELTVSATPGIISISDEEDDEEPTASQRPPSARKTPTPTTGGLQTPLPSFSGGAGVPRLPAPLPPPGRTMRLPTPSGGMSAVPMALASPASAPSRSLTPALPIPAPLGSLTSANPGRPTIFSKVQLPIVGLVSSLIVMFGIGFLLGAVVWRGQAAPIATEPPPPAPAVAAKPEPAPPPVVAPTPPPPVATAPAAEAKPVAEPAPAPEPPAVVEPVRAVKHLAVSHPKPVVTHKAPPEPAASPKPVVAAAKPTPRPVAAAKPAKAKAEKAKAKNWVDPFAE